MSSQNTSAARRVPQRRRGHERVAALLDAADACFAESGYDAATMTAIAARAGAAIGSLYQFFPTKEAVAEALLAQHTQTLLARLAALRGRLAGGDLDQVAAGLVGFLADFRRRHPAYVVLLESTGFADRRGDAIRQQLRAELSALLAEHLPAHPAPVLRAATLVVQQLMKAAVALQAQAPAADRRVARAELERALRLYLHDLAHRPAGD
ncbi:TetR family transcriptional regulator [Frateuria defendens]|uniref:TetR family transcriptional regulator n=1 Tax=Frateuria defendens TaxID=2219559 RepID=UPI00069FFBE1|nr:TetR family transcriptional regulator [Frateuria defendens]